MAIKDKKTKREPLEFGGKPNTKRKPLVYPKPNTGTGKTYYVKPEINATKIHTFLNNITDAEFIYIHKTIDLAQNFKDLIKYYNLSKDRFCEEMKISKIKYNSYIRGSRNYDLMDIARIQALSLKLKDEKEKADKNPKSPVEYVEKRGRVQSNKQ